MLFRIYEVRDVLGALDHLRAVRRLAARADDLLVVGVADEQDLVAGLRVADRLVVHLGHQRARRVDRGQAALLGLLAQRRAHAVRAEHHHAALGHVGQVLDELHAATAEAFHHVAVVHDLVVHEDRLAGAQLQQLVDHYAPVGPVEWHLIQQIAMGMLKQWRVWSAEAIAGDQAVAAQALDAVYPEVDNAVSFGDKTAYHPDTLKLELRILSDLYYALTDNFDGCPTGGDRSGWVEWLTAGDDHDKTPYAGLVTMVEQVNYLLRSYPPPAWAERPLYQLLYFQTGANEVVPDLEDPDLVATLKNLKSAVERARAAVQDHLKKTTDLRSQLKTLKAQRDRGHALPESLQLLARYETHVNRQLAKALDQLKKLQDDRLSKEIQVSVE